MITCEDCGKFTDGQKIGNHWVCEDCRIQPKGETNNDP